ncbi:MAG: cupin domain-containing protein [Caldilineaceae bacterium]|nr:cupin domain-containing protein [Caldilineaceae bacterium]
MMADTTVKKIDSAHSPRGEMGQKYLAAGTGIALRLWDKVDAKQELGPHRRNYETVGYVIEGRAKLHLAGQIVTLAPGDSWVVPKGAEHHYEIVEPFTAVEATHPPAHVHGRDATG